jgi:hypothetical protein
MQEIPMKGEHYFSDNCHLLIGVEVHSGDYEELYLLGYNLVQSVESSNQSSAYYLFHADFFLGFFDPEDGVDMFLRNVD